MKKRFPKLSLPTIFLLVLYSVISCAPSSARQPTDPTNTITIIGTGDLQGHLDADLHTIHKTKSGKKIGVTGGISRLATLISRIQQKTGNPVIVISSGDDLMGQYFHKFHGKAIFGLMQEAGYQIAALGNHEFDKGPGVLAEALNSIHFPVLCSDLEVQGTIMEKSCQPYVLKKYQGIRIGFFSLMTNEFPIITVTGQVKVQPDQVAVARDMVQLLKKRGAQVIIAVTHIGTNVDRTIAAQVPGIDIIFGGHSHNYMDRPKIINNTLIVNGGEKGSALVRLDVSLNGQGVLLPNSAVYSLIPVTRDIKEDSKINSHLATYRKQLPTAEIIGQTRKTWILTTEALRTRESGVADMITDMIRNQFRVDVVLYNGGAFRGNSEYPPGPITSTMLSTIDEFSSMVFLLTLKGKYIRQILEHSATLRGQGGFLQVSGIRYTMKNSAAQIQELTPATNSNTASLIRHPGNRVNNIRILSTDGSWQPLDPERNYRLATNDFLVTRNGNGFLWFKKYGQNIRNSYASMADVIRNYLQLHKVADPPEPDGRITIQ